MKKWRYIECMEELLREFATKIRELASDNTTSISIYIDYKSYQLHVSEKKVDELKDCPMKNMRGKTI